MGSFARLLVAVSLLSSGCAPASFLITTVSPRGGLVETELSRDSLFAADKIVLIDASGVLSNAREGQLLGVGEHPVSLLVEQLDKARRDRRVRGVILRINSPGGTVVASELMHDEIMHFRKSGKPVVAVMMDVAASGGYYIACACDEIVAQASTITGSIGVVMQLLDVSGTMQMIGVKGNAIISGVHKDTGSPFRAMRAEERELFQHIVDEMYGRFVDVVTQGRPTLDEAAVRRLADGRVYTASQALEAGLIDRIATMREAVAGIKQRVGSKSARLVTYHRSYDERPNFYASSPPAAPQALSLLSIHLQAPWGAGTPKFMYLWRPGL